MCPKRTSVVQSLELNFFFGAFTIILQVKRSPLLCTAILHEAKESFFGAAVKKDDHSRHGGFITLKPPCARRLASRRWPVCPSSRVASASWTTWQPGKPTLNRIAFPVGELGRSLRMSAISLTTSIHGPPGLYTSARKRPSSVYRLT